ncbi:ribonuclease H-like domain, reverse transcriptase, RNA-dependent DNA polymerase [Tanacetum coccineum]
MEACNPYRHQKAIGLKWHGIDYDEVFAPVARMETVRLILALSSYHGWEVHHLDVKSTFLHALYGLKQAPRAWNMKLDQTLKSLDFKKCTLEQAIYTRISKDSMLLVGVYVDNLIVTGSSKEYLQKFKSQMEEKFEMSDLGLLAYYLGIEVTQTEGGISIKQSGYANKILKEARMEDCNESKIPMDPGTKLIKTEGGELKGGCKLHGYSDSSYGINIEEEFMAATAAACQALWLQRLLNSLTNWKEEKVTIRINNKLAITLMKNPVLHGRSKHIDIRYHFIKECVEKNQIEVEHISGDLQKADILTKALARIKFTEMRELLGVKNLKEQERD